MSIVRKDMSIVGKIWSIILRRMTVGLFGQWDEV